MASLVHLSRDERIGLGVAATAHIALVAALLVYDKNPAAMPMPERMTVSLASEVSLESTAPDPSAEPQASIAPELSPEPEPAPPPQPAPPPPTPRQEMRPEPRPQPAPEARPTPAPRPSPTARPSPTPTPTPRATATPTPAPRPTATPTPTPRPTQTARPSGARVGADFLEGASSGERSQSASTPAASFGATEQAALSQAINRQLKPHWSAPQGVDAELLVTVLSFELNRDGSLRGTPQVVSQSGINASNRPQASLHAERAIRAVQLAAPFNLPEEYYDRWRRVSQWRFDRRL